MTTDPNELRMPLTAEGRRQSDSLTLEQHQIRHIHLHRSLDELVADWVVHNVFLGSKTLSTATIMDLMEWSYSQTQKPTEPKEENE